MKTNTLIAALCALLLAVSTHAAGAEPLAVHTGVSPAVTASELTGALSADLAGMAVQDPVKPGTAVMMPAKRKSPVVAGLMSLAIPGAGEVYSGEYTKGAIFFVAEVVGLTVGILQNKKGDDRTTEFQAYADEHWSAVKYAQYLNTYAGVQYRADKKNATIDLTAPRDVLWSQINAYEEGPWAEGFSHKLPKYPEQQYYELIGKYNQFKYGWDTYPVDPATGLPRKDTGYNNDIPQQLLDYAKVRGTANDFYSASRLAFSLVVVNHLLSAVDGYLSARHYNTGISSHMSMDLQRHGDAFVAVPQLCVTVGL